MTSLHPALLRISFEANRFYQHIIAELEKRRAPQLEVITPPIRYDANEERWTRIVWPATEARMKEISQ